MGRRVRRIIVVMDIEVSHRWNRKKRWSARQAAQSIADSANDDLPADCGFVEVVEARWLGRPHTGSHAS